ncbi:MAG: ABC transporter substrate-binding protein [Streptosporangiales bacterium]|nr:ABC transporter substrate-binding protein [Streptosporangiales bacterium]
MSRDADVPTLKTVTRTQGANAALKEGTVRPDGFAFDFEEIPVLVHGFRRMVRNLEFDISEMAFTTYLCAKAHGVRFSALPIFLVRGFHHGAIVHNTRLGIRHPKDLEGRRVGVNRGYTVTTGVWARGILADEYGVDLDSITWVLSGDEHVADYRPPPNVVPVEPGHTLEDLVGSGDLAAAIGVGTGHPDVAPLIPDAGETAFASFQASGFYPINHLVVVRDELLEARPELAGQVMDVFERAKDTYVDRLRAGAIDEPGPDDRRNLRAMEATGGDPLPYGVEPNRAMVEKLMGYAVHQRILDEPMPLDTVFPYSG